MLIEQLYTAYLGELYGIAFFSAFTEKYSDNQHINKWQTLLRVEQVTARLLKAGLESLGKPCPSVDTEMTEKGLREAEKWLELGWTELIDTMIPWVEPYALKYRQQARQAGSHQALFQLVQEHEDAILAFLLAEQSQQGNSLAPLQHFLSRYGEAFPDNND